MRLCLKYDVPFILENPQTSFLWDLPELQALVNRSDCYVRVLDFCQFGTKWKKPTRFLFGGIPWSDSEPLQRRCEARGGRCSRTGQKHLILEGPGPDGRPWTRTAQPYPLELCRMLAWVLTSRDRALHQHSLERFFGASQRRRPGQFCAE